MLVGNFYYSFPNITDANNKLYGNISSKCTYPVAKAQKYWYELDDAQTLLNLIRFKIQGKELPKFYGYSQSFYEGLILYIDLKQLSEAEKQEFINIFSDFATKSSEAIERFIANYKKHVFNIMCKLPLFFFNKDSLNNSIIALTQLTCDILICLQSGIKLIRDKYLDKTNPQFRETILYERLSSEPEYVLNEIDCTPPYYFGRKKDYQSILSDFSLSPSTDYIKYSIIKTSEYDDCEEENLEKKMGI